MVNKGYKQTEEHRKKISLSLTGRKLSEEHRKKVVETRRRNNNYIVTEETRKKLSIANKGNPNVINAQKKKWENPEYRENIVRKRKGKTYEELYGKEKAEETKRKMSLAHKGRECYWKGRKMSEEHRKNISLGNIGKTKGRKASKESIEKMVETNIKKGNYKAISKRMKKDNPSKRPEVMEKIMLSKKKNPPVRYWIGKKRSKESIRKTAEGNRGKKAWNKGITLEKAFDIEKSNKIREKIKKARAKQKIPLRDSSIEVKLQNFLKILGLNFYTHQYMKEITHAYQCDIFIPLHNTVIECDGDYFHGNPKFYPKEKLNKRQKEQKERDNIRTKELLEKGFRVIRLWEEEIKEMKIEDFQEKLEAFR